ncbi:Scr1 family TA system antitoxin-like transcriptional regulator [Glycomyces sp. NPDC021274]|uniref:Scr1 family TA system antitoxin-like transcriptional regulator n=1 Tax=Glycomyces sp. NPDC021274 TaxID=3155120 RepID=UPI0033F89D6D
MPLSHLADWYVPAELQALYSESGLTYGQIGAKLGVSVRTIGNYLTGETRPKLAMAAKFAEVCGATEKRTEFLIHVISQMDHGRIVSDLDERNIFIVERAEATSGEFWKFDPWYIPGPLQLEQYHMELQPDKTPRLAANWQRKKRRHLRIFSRRPAPAMKYLISTNALHPLIGWEWGAKAWNHLLELDQKAGCEIRLLDGLHPGVEHAFEIYLPGGMKDAPPPFVYVEAMDQSRHIEETEKIELYHGGVKGMWSFGSRIGGRLDDWVH